MTELWTEKHKPKTLREIAGQQKSAQEVLFWLSTWKPGEAMLLHGSPGIGKTLIVETLAKEKNYDLLQLDASDTRNQKSIESFLGSSSNVKPLFHKGRFILIDEVDGISGRSDRGAVTSVVKFIKVSRYPVFIIANDPYLKKLRPLKGCSRIVKVPKVRSPSVEKRLKEIAEKEGLEYKPESMKNLARWSQGDMRSAINDLQMLCSGNKCMTDKDMESLGYRERSNNFYNVLPTIFRSGKISATRKVIWDSDMDPDEILWWVEQNFQLEVSNPDKLARGFDVLSKADLFRSLISKQQNWRFKAFMVDMISSISLFGEGQGYIPYKPPKRFTELSRTMIKRAKVKSLAERMGSVTHNSTHVIKRDYFPYLRIILRNPPKTDIVKSDYALELDDDDIKLLA